jgi:hypothetical protein
VFTGATGSGVRSAVPELSPEDGFEAEGAGVTGQPEAGFMY